jgi:hypothetical protein
LFIAYQYKLFSILAIFSKKPLFGMPTFVVLISKNQFFLTFKCFFMKKLFFLLLPMMAAIWLTTIGGCRKCSEGDATYRACGSVVEFGTNKPIPNAKVTFSDYGSGGGGSNITPKATLDADLDGHFCYEGKTSIISAEASGYYPSGDDFIFVGHDVFDDYMVALYPEAWIKVTYRNESGTYGISGIDALFFNRLYEIHQGEDFTVIADVKGNKKQNLIYTVFSAQDKIVPDLNAAKVLINSQPVLPKTNGLGSSAVEFIPTGHDTTNIQIIF